MQEGCTLLFCSAKLSSAPREKLNGESWREKDETSINYSVSVNLYVCLKVWLYHRQWNRKQQSPWEERK